jgi:hypothetical protein
MSAIPENSKAGPPLKSKTVEERQQLVAANEAFANRLTRALQRGDETPAGLLATVSEPAGFFPWRFNRTRAP